MPSSPTGLTGRTLGDFTVLEKLGEGGYGVVYRAEQRGLGRDAVIKVLHARHHASGTVVDSGSYLSVHHKVNGQWLYIRDTWNSDKPPAAAAPPAQEAPATK